MTPEGKIVQDIKHQIALRGGVVRKCEWSARSGAPDLLIMISGIHVWLEVKRPGGEPTPLQVREHRIMREVGGCAVYVVRSAAEALAAVDHVRGCHGL